MSRPHSTDPALTLVPEKGDAEKPLSESVTRTDVARSDATRANTHRLWTAEDVAAKEQWAGALHEAFGLHPRGGAGIADICGVSKQHVSRWLDPKDHVAPSLFDVARIARRSPSVADRALKDVRLALIAPRSSASLHELLHEVRREVAEVDAQLEPGQSPEDLEAFEAEIREAAIAIETLLSRVIGMRNP